jgi:hypothetical protein
MRVRIAGNCRILGCICALLAAAAAGATENADFAVRVIGGGTSCAGEEAIVEVRADFNLTGENTQEVRGFALPICHVPYQLEILEAKAGTGFDPQTGVDADFNSITVSSRGVVQTVIVDLREPRGIPPVNDFPSLEIRYLVEDAADPARVWPCDRTIGSPPAVLSFSTGSTKYEPAPGSLEDTEISSPCDPPERTFRVRAAIDQGLRVYCGAGTGSTIVDVLVSEDPVACCPPRLLKGISLSLQVPEDLSVVRFLPGDLPAYSLSPREGDGCWQIDTLYLPSPRLEEERVAVRVEVAAVPGFWPDGFPAAQRDLRFGAACLPEAPSGVILLDGAVASFTPETGFTFRLPVVPYCPRFKRGDVDGGGSMNLADATQILMWLYTTGGPRPTCMDAADANDDGRIDISDPIYILTYLFASGTPPPPPLEACGKDLTEDDLDCDSFAACPGS